jgi:2-polyprenyl-3-methyl-5-hydroxy-6-metoxy-1,4-benzoquinol methylase
MKTASQFNLATACPSLQLGDDGIFYAAASEAISYPEEGNETYFQIEDQSFWFRHRNDCIRELVRNFTPQGPLFDVGGGNGVVAKGLMDEGWEVVLVEPGPSGARNAKRRGLEHVICGTTHSAGFKNGSLPAIGVFDVVEHIEDDLSFLRHLWDLLEPAGMLYLTVPSYNFLWSHEDVDAGHFRRYTLSSMKLKLVAAGLKPVFGTYIFAFLPLPVLCFRTLPYRVGEQRIKSEKISAKDHVVSQGVFSRLLTKLLGCELNFIKHNKSLAFGGSCLMAARKE